MVIEHIFFLFIGVFCRSNQVRRVSLAYFESNRPITNLSLTRFTFKKIFLMLLIGNNKYVSTILIVRTFINQYYVKLVFFFLHLSILLRLLQKVDIVVLHFSEYLHKFACLIKCSYIPATLLQLAFRLEEFRPMHVSVPVRRSWARVPFLTLGNEAVRTSP